MRINLLKFLLSLLLVLFVPVANAENVDIGDIEVEYHKMGNGDPIILINGFGNPLDYWPPRLLDELKQNYTVITFDNRGVGNSTAGEKKFTIEQFAEDTNKFLDAINITKVHVLGFSMGGRIAQELALSHPEKIDKLIIYATACSGTRQIPADSQVMEILSDEKTKPTEMKKKLKTALYPRGFDFSTLPKSKEIVSDKTLSLQQKAIANWSGVCNELNNIQKPTLVIVGTKDNLTPPANSLLIAKNIPGAWLIKIEGGMHPVMFQYPEKFTNIILFFLS